MKNSFLLLLVMLISKFISANTIISFAISPQHPTSNDSITIIIENMFTSGGCDGSAILGSINGNEIQSAAMHCVGMLTVICTDYDTVVIPPLSPGSYNFIFTLSSGSGIPCTPGIVPDDIDTLSFVVDDATKINDLSAGENQFRIFPNPSTGNFYIENKINEKSILSIFSSQGKALLSMPIKQGISDINSGLQPGMYVVIIHTKNSIYHSRLIIN